VAVTAGGSTVRGRSIELFVERSGSGSPIVLLHGLADDHRLWRATVPRLADRYETFALDLPGHGRSGPIPEGATIDWFADEVRGVIEQLGLGRPVLVGLSMGGGVAQYVAIAAPAALRGLVLVSTSPALPEANRRRFAERAAIAERDGMTAVVDSTVVRWFSPSWAAGHAAEVEDTRRTVLATDPVQFVRASRANMARDCTPGLATIRCPVLFVGGLEDPADPASAAEIYRHELADVTVELLPGVSHLLPIEAPARFGQILDAFLARLDGAVP
jgi:pimeloyl-ACP methyl ester carboxylesterase